MKYMIPGTSHLHQDAEILASDLEKKAARMRSLMARVLVPHVAAVWFLHSQGYSDTEISQLSGIPREKVFVYRKGLGVASHLSSGRFRWCRNCEKAIGAWAVFCPRCGRKFDVPKSQRVLVDAHGVRI